MSNNKKFGLVYFLVGMVALALGILSYWILTAPKSYTVISTFPKLNALPTLVAKAHTGKDFSEKDFIGQWNIVFFGFTTCPDICPTTMSDMNKVAKKLPEALKKTTQFVFVSVDPERDTIKQLANYVPAFNPDFIGVTASLDETKKLAKNLGVSFMKTPAHDNNPDNYMVDHTARWFVIDPLGRRYALIDPSPFGIPTGESLVDLVVRDYQTLRKQAKK